MSAAPAAGGGTAGRASGRGCAPVVAGAAILLLLVVLLAVGSPTSTGGPAFDPRSTGPDGTAALVQLLERSGVEVDIPADFPPADADVAIVFRVPYGADPDGDLSTDAADEQLRRWVQGGRTLVVADPTSELTPQAATLGTGVGTPEPLANAGCDLDALGDLRRVQPVRPSVFRTPEGAASCFQVPNGGALVVSQAVGRGRIVSLGDGAMFTNRHLAQEDNAGLALALLGPEGGRGTAILRPQIFGGGADAPFTQVGGNVGELIGAGARFFVLQLVVATAVYAWVRGRRLGRPVLEPQPVHIAGSELVEAMGTLLQRTRNPDNAARVLRGALAREVSPRLGLPPDVDPRVLADAIANRTGHDPAEVLALVSTLPVTRDADLVDVARRIESIREEVLHGTAT